MEKLNHNSMINNSPLISKLSIARTLLRISLLILSLGVPLNAPAYSAPDPIEDPAESLFSLPYLEYVENEKAPDKIGTTIHKKDKAYPGYIIYRQTAEGHSLYLTDPDGTIIHRWTGGRRNDPLTWKAVPRVLNNESIFLNNEQSHLAWKNPAAISPSIALFNIPGHKSHHASYFLQNGGFLGLTRKKLYVPFLDASLLVEDTPLVHTSPDGKIIKTILLSKLFAEDPGYQKNLETSYQKSRESSPRASRKRAKKNPFDIFPDYNDKTKKRLFDLFHANNIESLEWDIPGIAKKGDWFVTVRNLNRVIIVDPEKEKIIWQWGENIVDHVHHATFLSGNRILLFDNGIHKKSSRVIIVDMVSREIIWQYGQKPGQDFFTNLGGSAQRLPNGNTLIAETQQGRAFEVTESGEIVWEWYANFHTQGSAKGKRKVIYRIEKIPYDFFKRTTRD
ncbi:MAG: hypothetical protein HQL21_05035 [Candidatus Omnitrophica bacterium]|nr:hypothetical protein [Candidatus Omnitrophota bacterium]